ncbi:MAG: hypothetical protein AAGG56_09505 [Pseudomonadota bacterium]
MAAKKRAKIAEQPKPAKVPKWQGEPQIEGSGPLSWRFSICDRGGPFCWELSPENAKQIMIRLAEFEAKTWAQIESTGSHRIECHRLQKAARDRLMEIGQDDQDELMSFRISGACRVWCIPDKSIMRVLWWDPEHQVYPTERDKGDRRKRKNRS